MRKKEMIEDTGWNTLNEKINGIEEKVDALYARLDMKFIEIHDEPQYAGLFSSTLKRAISRSVLNEQPGRDKERKGHGAEKTD